MGVGVGVKQEGGITATRAERWKVRWFKYLSVKMTVGVQDVNKSLYKWLITEKWSPRVMTNKKDNSLPAWTCAKCLFLTNTYRYGNGVIYYFISQYWFLLPCTDSGIEYQYFSNLKIYSCIFSFICTSNIFPVQSWQNKQCKCGVWWGHMRSLSKA